MSRSETQTPGFDAGRPCANASLYMVEGHCNERHRPQRWSWPSGKHLGDDRDAPADSALDLVNARSSASAPDRPLPKRNASAVQAAQDIGLAFAKAAGDPIGWQSCVLTLQRIFEAEDADRDRLAESLRNLADTAEGLNEYRSPSVCDEIKAARALAEEGGGDG